MIKIIYACLILLLSSALLMFTTGKTSVACKTETEGVIKEYQDSTGIFLFVETPDKKIFYPQITDDKVVLVSGSKVKICYNVVQHLPDNVTVININQVTYLP
ncbi:MAG: hypothetical protein SFU87_01935 [Chitinophagaceae bacterium]|nr:hypothetical protein [Chitinophagaceae bacterium]